MCGVEVRQDRPLKDVVQGSQGVQEDFKPNELYNYNIHQIDLGDNQV